MLFGGGGGWNLTEHQSPQQIQTGGWGEWRALRGEEREKIELTLATAICSFSLESVDCTLCCNCAAVAVNDVI